MTTDTQNQAQALRQRWVDNIKLIDEHVELERQLLIKLGAGSAVVSLALLVSTSVYATKIGAALSAMVLTGLLGMFFRSWYVLVGVIHDREELSAKLDSRVLVSFPPSILSAVRRPLTHRESSWPGLFVVPQALMLLLTIVAVTYFLGANRTLFDSLKAIVVMAVPATLIGSIAIIGALAFADHRQ